MAGRNAGCALLCLGRQNACGGTSMGAEGSSDDYMLCRVCASFQVRRDERYCPECGVGSPFPGVLFPDVVRQARLRRLVRADKKLRMALGIGAAICVAAVCSGGSGSPLVSGAVWAVALGAIWCSGRALGRAIAVPENEAAGGWCQTSMRQVQTAVNARLVELEERKTQLNAARTRVAAQPRGERWTRILAALDHALNTIQQQRQGYLKRLYDLQLVRWQNRLEPLAVGLESAGPEEIAARDTACGECMEAGKALRARARNELGECEEVDRVSVALDNAEKLRGEIVAQQAMLAVRAYSPAPADDPTTMARSDRPDAFAARVRAIEEITRSVNLFDAEYERLKAEVELVRAQSET